MVKIGVVDQMTGRGHWPPDSGAQVGYADSIARGKQRNDVEMCSLIAICGKGEES